MNPMHEATAAGAAYTAADLCQACLAQLGVDSSHATWLAIAASVATRIAIYAFERHEKRKAVASSPTAPGAVT